MVSVNYSQRVPFSGVFAGEAFYHFGKKFVLWTGRQITLPSAIEVPIERFILPEEEVYVDRLLFLLPDFIIKIWDILNPIIFRVKGQKKSRSRFRWSRGR